MTSTFRNAAFGLALIAAAVSGAPVRADQPDAGNGSQTDSKPADSKSSSDVSIEKLNKEFQSLSPEARDALMHQLEQRGVDGLSHMNEKDARTAFAGLPDSVRTELQAKWDQMSDEDHDALKKLNPDTVKQMVEDKIKDSFKPSEKVMAVMEKAKATTDKMRDTLKAFWAKLTGKAPADGGDQQQAN
jgi:hypothetical protein